MFRPILDPRQTRQWAVLGEENESEYSPLLALFPPVSAERLELVEPSNRYRHVLSLLTADDKLEVLRVPPGRRRKVELDACERELECDTFLVDDTVTFDWQRTRRHRHAHVHCSETLVVCHLPQTVLLAAAAASGDATLG
jgi:hypothetical protein